MKKLLAMLVLVALVMTACFASAETASDPYMGNARAYLRAIYKNSPVTTTVDDDVVGVVTIADTTYPITWSVDTDAVKIIINDNGMGIGKRDWHGQRADFDGILLRHFAEAAGNFESRIDALAAEGFEGGDEYAFHGNRSFEWSVALKIEGEKRLLYGLGGGEFNQRQPV